MFYLNAANIFLDGPLPCVPGPAGALSFNNTTRTILQRKSKFNSIDRHTGATKTFVNELSFIQHNIRSCSSLKNPRRHP